MTRVLLIAVGTFGIDQASKALAGQGHDIAGLQVIDNTGTLAGTVPLTGLPLLGVAIGTVAVFAHIGSRLLRAGRINPTALGLLIGGGAGNLLDRALLGYVRDFIWIPEFVFNIADVAMLVGVVAFVADVLRTAPRGRDRSGSRVTSAT